MKKIKILSVLGVLLAMGITACGGNQSSSDEVQPGTSDTQPGTTEVGPSSSDEQPSSSDEQPSSSEESSSAEHVHSFGAYTQTKAPTCTEAGSEEAVCECGEKDVRAIPALGHDYSGEGAVKVDSLKEEGVVPVDVYKCARCNSTSIRWDALKYDASSNDVDSKDGGIRFKNVENVGGTAAKGTHIIYKFNSYEANEKAGLAFDIKPSSNGVDLFNAILKADGTSNDNTPGYVYNENGELVPSAKRYALFVNDVQVEIGENNYGGPKDRGWYNWPVEFPVKKGENKIELVGLGGYRAVFYNFAVTGLGVHEHEANYVPIDSRLNSDNKTVFLGQDSFLNNKAIEIAFKDFSDAPANPSGTNPWYMAKGSFATWKVNVDKAIEGAKLYFSLECSSATHLERHLFNEAKWNAEHPDEQVKLPGQSPDTVDEAPWRYSIAVGDQEYPILNNGTMAESGVKATSTQTYVYFGDINLAAGENVIKLTQNNIGYRMKFNQNVRIVYNSDAVIAGEHSHLYNELVSETPATCTETGSKVMKCLCGETTTVETPALGHDWRVGEADANGVSALTCGREGCTASGLQMHAFDGDNASCLDGSNKMVNGTKVTWAVNMPKAGTYELYLQAKHSANQANQKFGDGYGLSAGSIVEGTYTPSVTGTNNLTTDKAYKDVGLNQNTAEYFLVGSIALTQGDIVIQFQNAGTQGYRLIYENSLRLIFVA